MQFMSANGTRIGSERAAACKSGKMAASMKACGRETKQMAKAVLFIMMETAITASGSTIGRTVSAPLNALSVRNMLDFGAMISRMGLALKSGPTAPFFKAFMKMEKSMALACSNGMISRAMLEIFKIIIYPGRASTSGATTVDSKENG